MSGPRFREALRRAFMLAAAWGALAFLVLPMLVVVPVSLTDRPYLSLPQRALSLAHYRELFVDPVWLAAAGQSLLIALAATFGALLLGSLCAIGCWRLSGRLSSTVRLLMLLPLIVPTVVQGLAMYRVWVALGLFDSYPGVILAHTLTGIPYVVITVSASLAGFDARLERAARSLGASVGQTVRLVILPAIVPGLLAGGLFAFVNSFDELVIVLFLTSRRITTLPKRIWDGLQDNIDPAIASVAVVLMLLTLAALLGHLLLHRHPRPRRVTATAGAPAEA